ncbi:unnamed protein product [Withania somnifera]
MVMTNFNGTGVGFGAGIGCGFGVGWGFGGMPLNILGLGVGGGCGIGVGLGWGFGSAFGSQYRNSRVTFEGIDFVNKASSKERDSKELAKSSSKANASQMFTLLQVAQHKSKQDCWIIIHDRVVVDVTKFLEEHPREEVLIESAGKMQLKNLKILDIVKLSTTISTNSRLDIFKLKIQDDDNLFKPKYLTFVEYFVAFLSAAFFLYYRYFTRALQL